MLLAARKPHGCAGDTSMPTAAVEGRRFHKSSVPFLEMRSLRSLQQPYCVYTYQTHSVQAKSRAGSLGVGIEHRGGSRTETYARFHLRIGITRCQSLLDCHQTLQHVKAVSDTDL
jgi:hypothetical protein